MSKSYDLEEQELRQNLSDGYISKEEFDRMLREIKASRKDSRKNKNVDAQED